MGRWYRALVVLAVTMTMTTACTSPARSEVNGKKKAGAMTKPTSKDILDRVDELARQRPFSASSVSKLTGVSLDKVAGESRDYCSVARSGGASGSAMFSVVEVRAP